MIRTIIASLALLVLAACGATTTPAPAITPAAPGTSQPTVPPASTTAPNVATLNAIYVKKGGIAGINQSITLSADGTVLLSDGQARRAPDGAQAAAQLAKEIEATGIYSVPAGKFLPPDPCCDRFTYELTLVKDGKTYLYTTMDGAPSVPPAMLQTIALIEKYAAAAK